MKSIQAVRGSFYVALAIAVLAVASVSDAASLQCHRDVNAPSAICFDPDAVTTVNPDLHSVRLVQSDADAVRVLPLTLLRNCRSGLTQVWDGQGAYYPQLGDDATVQAISAKVCQTKGFVLSERLQKGFVLSERLPDGFVLSE